MEKIQIFKDKKNPNPLGCGTWGIEQRTGQPVISPINANDKHALDTNLDDVKQIESK